MLGEFLTSIERDFKKAYEIFAINCEENNYDASCNKAGFFKITGQEGVEANPVRN